MSTFGFNNYSQALNALPYATGKYGNKSNKYPHTSNSNSRARGINKQILNYFIMKTRKFLISIGLVMASFLFLLSVKPSISSPEPGCIYCMDFGGTQGWIYTGGFLCYRNGAICGYYQSCISDGGASGGACGQWLGCHGDGCYTVIPD